MTVLISSKQLTDVLISAIKSARQARLELEAGRVGMAISGLMAASFWIGFAHAWSAQVERQDVQIARIRRVRMAVNQVFAEVAAVVDARCAVMAMQLPASTAGRPS